MNEQYNMDLGNRNRSSIAVKFLIIPLFFSAFVDFPSRLEFGEISGLAVLSIVYAAIGVLLWIEEPIVMIPGKLVKWFLFTFMVFGYLSFLWYPPRIAGLQNMLVLTGFICLLFLSARECAKTLRTCWLIYILIIWTTRVALVIYGISLLIDGLGTELIIGSRTFALFCLLGISWHLSSWRYGSKSSFFEACIIVIFIGLSLSRLALVVALLLFPISRFNFGSFRKILSSALWLILVLVLFYLILEYAEPLRSRFFEGDLSLRIGSHGINVAGRWNFWRVIFNSYLQSPWIGKGAGSAQEIIASIYPLSAHPHNDYLRILHDYGLIGLLLWEFAYVSLLRMTRQAQIFSEELGSPEAQLHLAAFLALIACALSMITDNTIVYAFMMAPLGIIVGMSIGRL